MSRVEFFKPYGLIGVLIYIKGSCAARSQKKRQNASATSSDPPFALMSPYGPKPACKNRRTI
jgi:hypothetical protein